ncbi:hypothetical protein B0H17DRAFT_1129467 [Mycena rosella]|uniref:Uncharacterized protein n=1 Tax=Mycena rosella TaxID=1033263 RepID=A0AAD7DST1_MYCRO|nr:hypothetical protein B0H17DRAFT_1129467 [Mycena rosella]
MSGNSPINTSDPYHSEEEPSSGPPCTEDIGIILFKKLIQDCGGSLGQEMATTFVQELQQAMGQEDLHNEMKEQDANTPPDLREMCIKSAKLEASEDTLMWRYIDVHNSDMDLD